jgi:hypothetical protein
MVLSPAVARRRDEWLKELADALDGLEATVASRARRTAKAWRFAWQGKGLSRCLARMDGFTVSQISALVVCFAIRT